VSSEKVPSGISRKPESSGAGCEIWAMRPSVVAGDSGIASLACASRCSDETCGRLAQAGQREQQAKEARSSASRF
jgi:hypothetical protein